MTDENLQHIVARPVKKIAIFGTTPSRGEGPHQDNSGWERWTIGPGGKDAHNWDRLFEVHGTWPESFKDYLNDLSQVKKPKQVIFMPQPQGPAHSWQSAIAFWKRENKIPDDFIKGDWEAVVRYPREEILEKYGRCMWFSSSIAWAICLAIEEGATDIGLWGIDLESGEEYIAQFVGCAHFLDLARIIGINVHLPRASGLLRDTTPYPDRCENLMALTTEKKAKWIEGILATMEPQYDGQKADVHRQEGRLLAMQQLGAKPEDVTEAQRVLIANSQALGQLACNINQLKGELLSLIHI